MKLCNFAYAGIVVFLTACGGGGSSAPPTSSVDAVTSASNATVSTLGMQPVSVASGVGYDVNMVAGDTWRLSVNESARTYSMEMIQSDFGAPQTISGAFTESNGLYTIATTNGFSGNFKIDPRTKTAVGYFSWTPSGGSQIQSAFSASGYGMTSTNVTAGKLDGTYAYGGSLKYYSNSATNGTSLIVQNPRSGANRTVAGTLNVSGTTVTVCENGTFVAPSSCSGTGANKVTYIASFDQTKNVIRLTTSIPDPNNTSVNVEAPAGIVHVQAGDRGPVLTIDISKPDTTTGQTIAYSGGNWSGARVLGNLLAAKVNMLGANESNGTWTDVTPGSSSSAVINGSSITLSPAISVNGSSVSAFQFELNKAYLGGTSSNGATGGGVATDVNGAFRVLTNIGGGSYLVFQGFPLSSSLGAILYGDGTMHIYRRM